jgi:hypothetical protein
MSAGSFPLPCLSENKDFCGVHCNESDGESESGLPILLADFFGLLLISLICVCLCDL